MSYQMRYPPLLAEEHERERAELAALRAGMESTLERMIELLDELDGDPDAEPYFGHVCKGYLDEAEGNWPGPNHLDADSEPDSDAEDEGLHEAEPDDEPTLGWPNNVGRGAETLSSSPEYQFAGLDGEYEPNLATLRGGQS